MGPFTLLTAGTFLAKTGMSIFGSFSKYDAYKQQEANVIAASQRNAALVREAGMIQLDTLKYKNRLANGIDRANIGGTGFTDSGSNVSVLAQNEYIRHRDEATLFRETELKAQSILLNGINDASQYSAAAGALPFNTFASIVSFGADAASSYLDRRERIKMHNEDLLSASNRASAQRDLADAISKRMYNSPIDRNIL